MLDVRRGGDRVRQIGQIYASANLLKLSAVLETGRKGK